MEGTKELSHPPSNPRTYRYLAITRQPIGKDLDVVRQVVRKNSAIMVLVGGLTAASSRRRKNAPRLMPGVRPLEENMKPGLEISIVWFDAHLFELSVGASNGAFAGRTQLYENHDALASFASTRLNWRNWSVRLHEEHVCVHTVPEGVEK